MESWEAIAISQALRLGQFWHACNMPLTAHRYVNVKPLKIGINWRKFVPFHPLDLQKTAIKVSSSLSDIGVLLSRDGAGELRQDEGNSRWPHLPNKSNLWKLVIDRKLSPQPHEDK